MADKVLENGYEAYDEDDYELSFQLLLPYKDKGPSKAQFYLGMMHMNGFGTDGDLVEAEKLLKISAENGFLDAYVVLGIEYRNGIYFEKDLNKSFKYFEYAANKEHPEAMNELGWIYLDGSNDIPGNYAKSFDYFLKSSSHYGGSAYPLALMYYEGMGVEKNLVEAYAWSLLALEFYDRRASEMATELEKELSSEQKEVAEQLGTERFLLYLENREQ